MAKNIQELNPDQPDPIPNSSVPIVAELHKYLAQRMALGMRRYGVALQPNNGRDMLRDAFEESVDLCVYLAGVIIERDGRLP